MILLALLLPAIIGSIFYYFSVTLYRTRQVKKSKAADKLFIKKISTKQFNASML